MYSFLLRNDHNIYLDWSSANSRWVREPLHMEKVPARDRNLKRDGQLSGGVSCSHPFTQVSNWTFDPKLVGSSTACACACAGDSLPMCSVKFSRPVLQIDALAWWDNETSQFSVQIMRWCWHPIMHSFCENPLFYCLYSYQSLHFFWSYDVYFCENVLT